MKMEKENETIVSQDTERIKFRKQRRLLGIASVLVIVVMLSTLPLTNSHSAIVDMILIAFNLPLGTVTVVVLLRWMIFWARKGMI